MVLCAELPLSGSMSVMDGSGRCSVGIDPLALSSECDERERLAHELGHCLTGSFYNRFSPYDERARHERRAGRWAVDALVPERELCLALREPTSLAELAELFCVSEGTIRLALERHRELELAGA